MGETHQEIQSRANELGLTYGDGGQTGCPHQAYYNDPYSAGFWISVETPPCQKRSCGMRSCHLYGQVFIPDHGRWAKVPAAGKGGV